MPEVSFYHLVAVFFIVLTFVVVGLGSIKFFGKDNPIEEACEQVIKEETGIDAQKIIEGATGPLSSPDVGNKIVS